MSLLIQLEKLVQFELVQKKTQRWKGCNFINAHYYFFLPLFKRGASGRFSKAHTTSLVMNESKAEKSSILIFPEKPDYPSHTKEMKRKERSSSSARSNPRSLLKTRLKTGLSAWPWEKALFWLQKRFSRLVKSFSCLHQNNETLFKCLKNICRLPSWIWWNQCLDYWSTKN